MKTARSSVVVFLRFGRGEGARETISGGRINSLNNKGGPEVSGKRVCERIKIMVINCEKVYGAIGGAVFE